MKSTRSLRSLKTVTPGEDSPKSHGSWRQAAPPHPVSGMDSHGLVWPSFEKRLVLQVLASVIKPDATSEIRSSIWHQESPGRLVFSSLAPFRRSDVNRRKHFGVQSLAVRQNVPHRSGIAMHCLKLQGRHGTKCQWPSGSSIHMPASACLSPSSRQFAQLRRTGSMENVFDSCRVRLSHGHLEPLHGDCYQKVHC